MQHDGALVAILEYQPRSRCSALVTTLVTIALQQSLHLVERKVRGHFQESFSEFFFRSHVNTSTFRLQM